MGLWTWDLGFVRNVGRIAAIVAVCAAAALAQKTPTPANTALDEYRTALNVASASAARIKDSPAEASALATSLPDRYNVNTNGGKFSVDLRPLKKALSEYSGASEDRKKTLASEIDSALVQMRSAAEEFAVPTDSSIRQKRLQEILARREFNRVRGPTIFEIWWKKIAAWIGRMLMRIFGRTPSPETGYRIFVWVLITIAVFVLAVWLRRVAQQRQREYVREVIPFAPSARGWRAWLADARHAAENGNWRDAVHLAYWAGISNLEENGAWIPDRARTPREYLRLLSPANIAVPTLQELTRQFELIWYGRRPAEAADFQQTLAYLERLGCR